MKRRLIIIITALAAGLGLSTMAIALAISLATPAHAKPVAPARITRKIHILIRGNGQAFLHNCGRYTLQIGSNGNKYITAYACIPAS